MDKTALPNCRRERIASVWSFVEKCSRCTKTEPFGKGTVTQESRKFFIYRRHLRPNFDVSKNRGANIKKGWLCSLWYSQSQLPSVGPAAALVPRLQRAAPRGRLSALHTRVPCCGRTSAELCRCSGRPFRGASYPHGGGEYSTQVYLSYASSPSCQNSST